jgi:PiT family inorganic phosphate transporter
MFAFFLSSGLFLGWSLGANDASNVFGTAVGSGMLRFRTAAICCSIFVIIGAVISGAGASHTLGELGSVNAVAGAFIVAFAAAMSVYLMTLARYPVSTSQAIVGAIIGWNLFSGSLTDYNSLTKIVLIWVACPILSAVIAMILYKLVVFSIKCAKIHMFKLDGMTRYGLLLGGMFGSYSLGANNIANVMGVFVPVSPFSDISIFGMFNLTSAQQLFFLGGVAIAIGVFTYSKRVMMTVGEGIIELSPVAAFVAVWSHSIVLFLFASQGLEAFLIRHGLPSIPLVPVSSSQAIVGAVIGMGLLKGGKGIRWRVIGGITSGWITTPIIAALLSFICLFFLQNVFQQKTYRPVNYILTIEAMERIRSAGMPTEKLGSLFGKDFPTAAGFKKALSEYMTLTYEEQDIIMTSAEIDEMGVTKEGISRISAGWFNEEQKRALHELEGREFVHKWQLNEALAEMSSQWRFRENDKDFNKNLRNKLSHIYRFFRYETDY